MTYTPKLIKIYLIKFYITHTIFCTASWQDYPSLIPHIITVLDHVHMIDHCPNDYHI